MRSLLLTIAFALAFGTAPLPGAAQSRPVLECELAPFLCPQIVSEYLQGPIAASPEYPSTLGVLAARLARLPQRGLEGRRVSEALVLVGQAMRPHDDALAERILLVANRRIRLSGSDDDPSDARAAPPADPPIFASPS